MVLRPKTPVSAQLPISISNIFDIPLDDIHPWSNNPRKHPDKQVSKIMASLSMFGPTNPLIVDEHHNLLSGHGRVEAARRLGWQTFPARVISGLTEDHKRTYLLTDNKLAELSAWDADKLKVEIELLLATEIHIEMTGFSTAEIDLMFGEADANPKTEPGELQPEDLAVPGITRTGDTWLAGSHRIACGNALQESVITALMQGQLAQMVISDPPYNVPVHGHVCGKGRVRHNEFAMASGEMSRSEFTGFLTSSFTLTKRYSQDGAVHYYFMDWRHLPELFDAIDTVFGKLLQLIAWVKDNGGMGTFYRSQHEMIGVTKNGAAPHINTFELGQHGRYRTNVWTYPGVNTFTGKGHELLALHPTVKNTSMIADAIRDCSHRNGIILDPFSGSGTILIAAEKTGRQARAIELDPRYVDVAVMRWQRYTGKEAVLEATGQTWSQVQTERLGMSDEGERE